ncbi:hypothetical protein LTR49_025050, partial [Elasticomyces elasticus]
MAPFKILVVATRDASHHTDGTTSSAFGGAEKTAATLDDDEGFADFEFSEELNNTLPGAESAAGTILEADVTDADSTFTHHRQRGREHGPWRHCGDPPLSPGLRPEELQFRARR